MALPGGSCYHLAWSAETGNMLRATNGTCVMTAPPSERQAFFRWERSKAWFEGPETGSDLMKSTVRFVRPGIWNIGRVNRTLLHGNGGNPEISLAGSISPYPGIARCLEMASKRTNRRFEPLRNVAGNREKNQARMSPSDGPADFIASQLIPPIRSTWPLRSILILIDTLLYLFCILL
jgi:hypothetical protein